MIAAANHFGLYSVFQASRAIFFKSSLVWRFTVETIFYKIGLSWGVNGISFTNQSPVSVNEGLVYSMKDFVVFWICYKISAFGVWALSFDKLSKAEISLKLKESNPPVRNGSWCFLSTGLIGRPPMIDWLLNYLMKEGLSYI